MIIAQSTIGVTLLLCTLCILYGVRTIIMKTLQFKTERIENLSFMSVHLDISKAN